MPRPPDFKFKKKMFINLLSVTAAALFRLSPREQNRILVMPGSNNQTTKKSKPEVRGRREPSFIHSTNACPGLGSRLGGEPHVWKEASLSSARTVHESRRGPAPPAHRTKPVSTLPGKTDHRLLHVRRELPQTPQAETDSPGGAAHLAPHRRSTSRRRCRAYQRTHE